MRKRKTTGLFLLFLLSSLFVTGCAKEPVYVPVTTNTIEVTEDGNVIGYMVESFDKEYYDIEELESMVRTELGEYNTASPELKEDAGRVPIEVDRVIMAEDGSKNVVVALNFQNTTVYADYMGKELFYGTVAEAIAAGYEVDKKLSKVKGGDLLTGDLLQKNMEKKILILEDAVSVRLPQSVQFLSTNAKLDGYGYVDCTVGEELKYIIIK